MTIKIKYHGLRTDEVQKSDGLTTAVAKMPGKRRIEDVERSGRGVGDLASTVLVAFSNVTDLLYTTVEHLLQLQTDFNFPLCSHFFFSMCPSAGTGYLSTLQMPQYTDILETEPTVSGLSSLGIHKPTTQTRVVWLVYNRTNTQKEHQSCPCDLSMTLTVFIANYLLT